MLKAIAIDNDSDSLELLKKLADNNHSLTLDKTFDSIESGLKHIRKFPVELVFADMEMCLASGKLLSRNKRLQTLIIFTSSVSENAAAGFEMNATDFLMKPYSQKRFDFAVEKAIKEFEFIQNKTNLSDEEKLFVRADYSLKVLKTKEILYVESLGDYVTIYLENQKKVITKTTMSSIHSKLNPKEFIRVNRSYIVPFSKIETFGKRLIAVAGKEIVIGDAYKKEFSDFLLKKSNLNKQSE